MGLPFGASGRPTGYQWQAHRVQVAGPQGANGRPIGYKWQARLVQTAGPFRLFPAKGRPCRRRDAASPPLSHLAFLVISLILAYKFFWKQPEQLVKTTSSFSPRNLAAILKPGAVAPGWQELFLSVVIVVSFSTKLIRIYIPAQARAAGLPITSDKITGFYRIDMIFCFLIL